MSADILVIGGGPSGDSTALHLVARQPDLAARILILEKARYPRHKLCGGALTVDAEVILQRLGLDVGEIPHVDASEAHFDFAGRGIVFTLGQRHALRMIRRDEFDAWLASRARRAGIEIREGINVRRVVPGERSVTVETDAGPFEAAIVVGADGSNGVTRRCVLPEAPIHTARALELLIPVDAATAHVGDVAYFEFAPVPLGIAGYTWDFPTQVNGQAVRCWGIYDTNLLAGHARPPLKEPLEAELNRYGSSLAEAEVEGHPIRWFSTRSALSVPRVLLVGDAAGADGIFGEGISLALGYGRLAADVIRDGLSSGDLSFRDYRRRLMRSPLGRALAIRTAITHIVYFLHWPWFQRIFWRTSLVGSIGFRVILNWARRMT